MKYRAFSRLGNDQGFTLLELMVVVALLGVLMAMAIMVSPAFTRQARSDAGISQVLDIMRSAREVAISQRRNVELRFVGLTALQTARVDIGTNGVQTGTTILRTVELENHMQFRLEQGVTNTPDGFLPFEAIGFGASPRRMFTSEGTFVNDQGDILNGTLYLAIPGQDGSTRAITIMGATALIRAWRWNGDEWVE